jgi:alginate O-acetyltransferase complex protein AlgI
MIFNTPEYYVLLLLAALGFRVARGAARAWVLVLAGALFFVWFSLTAVGGVLGAWCLGLFLWESVCSRLYKPGSRWCWFGVGQAVLALFAFKYWNFFTAGAPGLHWAGAFLPLGISFFTFEFIHYAVDRHRGKAEQGSWGEYLSFILFFPTMVAGPIKRFQDWLETLRHPSQELGKDWLHGMTRILAGLAKKLAVADLLTAWTDHLNAGDVAVAPRGTLLLWVFAYGIKIYADFSAYSDIAIGSARLFGLKVKENFDWPYFRSNISEFWTHWHISLYRWLVDYVFIPLGGSRVGLPMICRNILITMLVSGLWHGASWNFLAWGAYHGVLLVGHRLWRVLRPVPSEAWLSKAGSVLLTYVLVNVGWAFFAMDLDTALLWLRRVCGV